MAAGNIPMAPENEDYATERAAAGGTDVLGPLPMGDGRADFPGQAYTAPIVVVGQASVADAAAVFRWRRLIQRRSWFIRLNAAGNGWDVTQRSRRGFPAADDDTGLDIYNDPTPSATRRMYIYDNSALIPGTAAANKVGDFINEEKQFTYILERDNGGGVFVECKRMNVGQVITVRRIAITAATNTSWTGVENSNAVRTLTVQITEAKVRAIVGGALPITIDAGANT
jgi:hypothetical protein